MDMTTTVAMEVAPWWALYTRHQHEKAVADGLKAKGFDVFLPLYNSVRFWKDRRKTISLPLFPCYVFVRGETNRRYQVMATPGVHAMLTCGGQIATIPASEIAAIQQSIGGGLRVEPCPFLNYGDRVRVVRGPMKGVAGILIRRKNLCRLILSVETLSRSVAVEVDFLDIAPEFQRMPVLNTSGIYQVC